MAETSWPTVAGSRVVTDDQFELMSMNWSADGADATLTSTPVFGDSSGRQVKVRAGVDAIVGGHGYNSGASDIIRSIAANASGSTRFDAIVLGLDRTTWAVTSYAKTGTPGAGVPPALTRNARGSSAGVWEIPLAMVQVANGAATISAANVTDIAWYSAGETVVTTSTNPLQPPAADYARMRHSDTGHEFDSVAGAWRRSPWQVARGFIGGKKYQGATTLAAVGSSEVLSGVDSGAVSLEANRRYRIHAHLKTLSTATAYATIKIRETNVSGTIIAQFNTYFDATGAHLNWYFAADITNATATTKTYVVTMSVGAGTTNSQNGNVTTTGMVGCFVEDIGPSSPNAITVV